MSVLPLTFFFWLHGSTDETFIDGLVPCDTNSRVQLMLIDITCRWLRTGDQVIFQDGEIFVVDRIKVNAQTSLWKVRDNIPHFATGNDQGQRTSSRARWAWRPPARSCKCCWCSGRWDPWRFCRRATPRLYRASARSLFCCAVWSDSCRQSPIQHLRGTVYSMFHDTRKSMMHLFAACF